MTAQNTIVKGIEADGDQCTWKLEVKNNSAISAYDVNVVFTIPAGISLIGPLINGSTAINVSQGVYNPTTNTWWIGPLSGNQAYNTEFIFQVDDISLIDPLENWFKIDALVSGLCEDDDCDNEAYLILVIGDPCDIIDLSAGEEVVATTANLTV